MRKSRWRSLARPTLIATALAAAISAMGGCTPRLQTDGLTGPCDDKTQVMCDATGICLPLSSNTTSNGGRSADAGAACPAGYTARQGASVLVPIPIASPEEVTAETASDLVLRPIVRTADGSVLEVFAPDGVPAGDGDFGPHRRIVTLTTTRGGKTFLRHVIVTVSNITASPSGDDANVGTQEHPFATLAHALSVAKARDTIELFGFNSSPDNKIDRPCTAPVDSTAVMVPSGVTVVGRDPSQTLLPMNVQLMADATLQNVNLSGARLVITKAGSRNVLNNDRVTCGVTVTQDAAGADLQISGGTNVLNVESESPLIVQAVGASVTIDASTVAIGVTGNVDTVRFDGGSQTLKVQSGSNIQNSNGHDAVHLTGSTTVTFDNANLYGLVEISDPKSTADITSSTFTLGANTGEVLFQGKTMHVTNSTFNATCKDENLGSTQCDGIIQDNPDSVVTVTGSTFASYRNFGYKLLRGQVQIESSSFKHDASEVLSDSGPFAIVVDAPSDILSVVTSRSSKYDVEVPLMPCVFVGGQKSQQGLYSISDTSNKGTVSFY